jgi:CubicO group peptidase (beta-lactamase class C family)
MRPTLADWQRPEHIGWSYRHIRELIPTARVAGAAVPSPLPRRLPAAELPGVAELMRTGFTDGLLVLQDGEVVLEEYGRGMQPDDTHLLQSVSKSITGTLAGVLVERGALVPDDPVVRHVPELAGSSFEGASVRDLLDMRAGTRFDETYDDPAQRHPRQRGAVRLGAHGPAGRRRARLPGRPGQLAPARRALRVPVDPHRRARPRARAGRRRLVRGAARA